MATRRILRTGWDRPVTAQRDGSLRWECQGFSWWYADRPGFNLGITMPDGECAALCYARSLKEAGLIAEGYGLGHAHARSGKTAPAV